MSNKNFMQKCLAGEILSIDLDEEFDNAIDDWHDSDGKIPLYKFLGMTEDQYDLVVEKPDFLSFVVFAKAHNLNLNDARIYSSANNIAARGCDSKTAKDILKWLRIKGKI